MTVHWFKHITLLRKSAVLACRKIKGRHTYDVITKINCHVFCEYGFTNKVTRVVKDNESNFVDAIRYFYNCVINCNVILIVSIFH